MLEISPLSPPCPILKVEKIKKDDHSSEQLKRKKKQVLKNQKTGPVQHIDEIV
jgi:hypothetical protein